MHETTDPTTSGYEKTSVGASVVPHLKSQPPAAPELLNDLVCNCLPDACASNYTSLDNEQPCPAVCNYEAACLDTSDPLTYSALYECDSDSESDE